MMLQLYAVEAMKELIPKTPAQVDEIRFSSTEKDVTGNQIVAERAFNLAEAMVQEYHKRTDKA